MSRPRRCFVVAMLLLFCSRSTPAAEPLTKEQCTAALHKAVEFFRTKVSVQGGYVYRVSDDLVRREGEENVGPTTVWIQPPGTPQIGATYLHVYELTGDRQCLDAARETAECLIRGQLKSGCWAESIELDPAVRKEHAYRIDGERPGKLRNRSTLDDNKSQSCVRFLMELDKTLKFADKPVHEAAIYALNSLLEVQYPNGAWPQRFSGPPEAERFPVKQASYPESWPRTWPKLDYTFYYTFNDNTIADTISVMLEAAEIYGDERYRAAAEKAGGFILLAQMPAPQPAWAQQYNADMQPAWARKFEPPAISGGESQGVLRILMDLYRSTGNKKYLERIPRALQYLKDSRLPNGRMARFNELHTNKPLYFTRQYVLTYEANDLPTHYGFIVDSKLDAIEAEYERLLAADPAELKTAPAKKRPKMSRALAERAQALVEQLDSRGAWVEDGRMRTYGEEDPTRRVIDSRTFVKNLEVLGQFLAAE